MSTLDAALLEVTVPVVEKLFILMHTLGSHGPDHPVSARAAGAVTECLKAARPPFALQLVAGGLFRDRVLVPVDAESYGQLEELTHALANLSANELIVERPPAPDELLAFGKALAKGRIGESDELDYLALPGLKWREILSAKRGVGAEAVEPEVFAAAEVTQALAATEALAGEPSGPWPWAAGVVVISRLERAWETDRATAERVLELAPGEWSPSRRAVCACSHLLSTLSALGTTTATRRAAAHATLALAVEGYRERAGLTIQQAAESLITRLLEAPVKARSGVEPHRLRVSSIIHHFATSTADEAPLEVMNMIELAYQLERMRCPKQVDFVLTKADLMAQAAAHMDRGFAGAWVRLLIKTTGEMPPGAWVRLADGRIGNVLGPGSSGDPRRPDVLVGGRLTTPETAVELIAPPAAHEARS